MRRMTTAEMYTATELASSLPNGKVTPKGGVICTCLLHDDKHPSFQYNIGRKGFWIGRCLTCGASGVEEAEAAGLEAARMYPNSQRRQSDWLPSGQYALEQNSVAKYVYYDLATSKTSYYKYRMKKPLPNGKKDMRCGCLNDNGEWQNNLNGLDTSSTVFSNVSIEELKQYVSEHKNIGYTEGEKDCMTLLKHGLCAFTFGSSSDVSRKLDALKYFKGATLFVFADNDTMGIESANQVAMRHCELGGDAYVIIPCEGEGCDITDFFERGGTDEQFRQMLCDAIDKGVEFPTSSTVEIDVKAEKDVSAAPCMLVNERAAVDLMQFHIVAENGKITGVYHNAIFEHIKQTYDLFVLGGTPYIYDCGYYKADGSGARLKSIIKQFIYPQFIKSTTINRIYELFLQDISLEVSFEDTNCYPSHWICFQNGMYDAKEKRLLPHSPKYRAVNQVPHSFSPNAKLEGNKIEDFLNFVCEDNDNREMLLEFVGYCLTKDVSQQKFLVLNGVGGTGKSTLIRLIETLVGDCNASNIGLTDLQQRFSSFGLLGKLLNSCADLEVGALEDTSIVKKILGEDTLRGEKKGRDAISFKSYAKLVFSANELPLVKSEKTNGFYRRLLVLTMNKTPANKNPNLFQELTQEIDYLLLLSVQALERMYQNGAITVSEASEKAVLQLRADSDTVEAFLQEVCCIDEMGKAERTDLFTKYAAYCSTTERQALTKNNFYKSLRVKGFEEFKTSGYRYFKGISYAKNRPVSALETAPKDEFVNVTQEQLDDLPFD